jgi:protein-tyrosine-phosphatase
VAVARTAGLSLARSRTAHVADVLREDDLVVAVCDNAHEELGAGGRLHWSVPDPARVDTSAAFTQALHDLAARIDRLAPAVHSPGAPHD